MIPDTPNICAIDDTKIEYNCIVEDHQNNMNDLIKAVNANGLNVLNHNMKLEDEKIINTDKCAICIDIISAQDDVAFLDCFHLFHNQCIEEYRKVNQTCPTCRFKYKNVVYFDSLKELFHNYTLKCQNKNCFYRVTLAQAKRLNKIKNNTKSVLAQISKKAMGEIKSIIIKDIKSTFIHEDSFTESISPFKNLIKKITIHPKRGAYKDFDEFFYNYTKNYSCPYPLCHFYHQETENFLKTNSAMIIPIIKKVFVDNLRGREKRINCELNTSDNSIKIVVNDCIFTYDNDNECTDGSDLFLQIMQNCISDSLLLKLKIDNPKLFNASKSSYIKDWNTVVNKVNIFNDGKEISIPIDCFIDYENNKLDNCKFKTAITDAQVDYSALYASAQDTEANHNNIENLPEETQRSIQFHELCTLTIINEVGCVTLMYRIIVPVRMQISYSFSIGFTIIE